MDAAAVAPLGMACCWYWYMGCCCESIWRAEGADGVSGGLRGVNATGAGTVWVGVGVALLELDLFVEGLGGEMGGCGDE